MKKLQEIIASPLVTKKLRAVWSDGTHTDFGAKGYSDFTIHHDKTRRDLYRIRHNKDHIDNPYKPGALSWYILWGSNTDLDTNIRSFKRRFRL